MAGETFIKFENVGLTYDLYLDKTNNLKEFLINKVTKRRPVAKSMEKVEALKNINIEFKQGDRVGIIGRNGAGKSTMLKVISGIYKPTAGRLIVNGTIQPLIEIGAGFDPEFTGRENIYLNGYMLGFSKDQIKRKEAEIIEFAELGEFIDVPVKYYSSGMSVRLAFTIATSIEPEILAFDEMLAAGDIEFLNKAKLRMDELINKAKMLILVSHDLSMISALCTKVLVVHQGQICFIGTPEEAIQFYINRGYNT
jgi:ABC-type polysaccharide/polyol phosphate transport system ATPase subunit